MGAFGDPIYLKTQAPVDHVLFYSHVAIEARDIRLPQHSVKH